MLQPSTATSFHIHQKENNLLLLHLPLLLDKCVASGPPENLIRPDTVKMQKRDTTRWTEQLCLYKHSLSYSNFISSSNYVTIQFTSEQKKNATEQQAHESWKTLRTPESRFFPLFPICTLSFQSSTSIDRLPPSCRIPLQIFCLPPTESPQKKSDKASISTAKDLVGEHGNNSVKTESYTVSGSSGINS